MKTLGMLQSLRKEKKLPHAILLTSANVVAASQHLAPFWQHLLCRANQETACQQCQSCHLFQAGTHPDFRLLPLAEQNKIGVDDIRDLIAMIAARPKIGGAQVFVLCPADLMQHQAANALLKVLEEPPPDSFLFLLSQQSAVLPITIRSRCLKWHMREIEEECNVELIQAVFQMLASPTELKSIEALKAYPSHEVLFALWEICHAMLCFHQANQIEGVLPNDQAAFSALAKRWSLEECWIFMEQLNAVLLQSRQGAPFNVQLFLEQLMFGLELQYRHPNEAIVS